ncbi:MAG: hypothetical protein HYU36_23405 [Planctomycetes bacterium]|nr:hypothetical protein [Planctomycetota bacterium]
MTSKFGLSGVHGPNATGPDGDTWIYGADLVVKWRPTNDNRGWPFVLWESEIFQRDYHADAFASDAIGIAEDTLHDWGIYTQCLYGFHPRWAAGLRFEYATGSGDSLDGRNSDPFRDDGYRVSLLCVWRVSEFARFRLQYNFDQAEHLEEDAHSVWLGIEFLYRVHAAHKY